MNSEARLLTEHGHDVMKYERTNAEIYEDGSLADKIRAFRDVAWSEKSYREIQKVIQDFRPDVMHVHNYKFILTPSIFAAAKDEGVATVLTLHNYRLICPGGQCRKSGVPCELCLDGNGWRVIWHRCFPEDTILKALLSAILYYGTKKRSFLSPWVDSYIALSEFAKQKFLAGGLPVGNVYIKPNFMYDPLADGDMPTVGHGAVYIGRISDEKGIPILLHAWKDIKYPLTIVGDGPGMARAKHDATSQINFTGLKSHEETLRILRQAAFFIFPSEVYETFGLSLLEAMACGKAVIASDLGPRREMIEDGVSGLLFKAGDVSDMRAKIDRLIGDSTLRQSMGDAARKTYLARYTPEKNYEILMNIYEEALKHARSNR